MVHVGIGQLAPAGLSLDDRRTVQRLRDGDERTFMQLVQRHGAQMLRVAQLHVRSRAVAEEVVQETWLAVLGGLDGFEGRASLRTWIFRILVNRARTRGEREARSVPFSALAEAEGDEPTVPAERFLGPDHRWAGGWASPPRPWGERPDDALLSRETVAVVERAIRELPPAQRAVISLRDVEGWDAAEVCAALDLSEGNQRVLLHRARAKVRRALEKHLEGAG